ncbi:MAG: hypothetical protein KDA22_08590, partial [Phycisphaerales bacterium]|nr:hypothetical protein [Phycisphaerales bacterium]
MRRMLVALMGRPYQLSLTVARLRRGVTACCWLVGVCLTLQAAVWSIAYFTQVRFEEPESRATATERPANGQVQPEAASDRRSTSRQATATATAPPAELVPAAPPAPIRSQADRIMQWSIEASAPVGAVCL